MINFFIRFHPDTLCIGKPVAIRWNVPVFVLGTSGTRRSMKGHAQNRVIDHATEIGDDDVIHVQGMFPP